MFKKKPALVILDRDGVINEDSDAYVKSKDEWQPIVGSIEAIKLLKKHHIPVAIATNQSGIARGLFDLFALHEMHQKLYTLLGQDADAIWHIAFCPHVPEDECMCRKPKVGLLEEISQKLKIPLNKKVYFVGDSFRDIEVAYNAGCIPVLVKSGKGLKTLTTHQEALKEVPVFDNLYQFVESIL